MEQANQNRPFFLRWQDRNGISKAFELCRAATLRDARMDSEANRAIPDPERFHISLETGILWTFWYDNYNNYIKENSYLSLFKR